MKVGSIYPSARPDVWLIPIVEHKEHLFIIGVMKTPIIIRDVATVIEDSNGQQLYMLPMVDVRSKANKKPVGQIDDEMLRCIKKDRAFLIRMLQVVKGMAQDGTL